MGYLHIRTLPQFVACVVALGILFTPTRLLGSQPPAQKKPQPQLSDRYGDPLPDGAVARCGSTRPGKRPAHKEGICFARFLPDAKTILSVGTDRTTCLWDAASGKRVREYSLCEMEWFHLNLSPDGKVLAIFSEAEGGCLHEVATGKELRRWKERTLAVAFSPDSKTLALSSPAEYNNPPPNMSLQYKYVMRSQVRLLDATTAKEIHDFGQHPGCLEYLLFSPDGKTLAVGGKFTTIPLPRAFPVAAPVEKPEPVIDMVSLWDLKTSKKFQSFGGSGTQLLFFSPDGAVLAIKKSGGSFQSPISQFDSRTGKFLRDLPLNHFGCQFKGISPDGKILSTWGDAADTGGIVLRDAATARVVCALGQGHGIADFSPDGKHLVTDAVGNTLLIWDLAAVKQRYRLPGDPTAKQLDLFWQDLHRGNSHEGVAAVDGLAAAGNHAVNFLKQRLAPVPKADVAKLVALLDARDFKTRDQATQQLQHLEFDAQPTLQAALQNDPPLELRKRVEKLLQMLEEPVDGEAPRSPESVRRWRAVLVLEQVGTPEARALLSLLASGAPAARLTKDARAALDRMDGRP